MKQDTHPAYQEVLFEDSSTGTRFVCGSTLKPKETAMHEGKEYPIYRVPVSSASHPFFTGSTKFIDTEGRVEKFRNKYKRKGSANSSEKSENESKESK
ncbi:MAG TPA: type B 50S ribosomal protein L31 [Chlamydiales bacterium]|nr:type B 50S ribosomal protein L31 [Chlamydiales bacterium]